MTEGVFMGLYFAGNSLSGSASKGRAAEHPRGVRRIRKAAKPPTAAQGGGPYGGTPSVTASGGDSSLKEGALEFRPSTPVLRPSSSFFRPPSFVLRLSSSVSRPSSPAKKSTASPTEWVAVEGEEIPTGVQFSAEPKTERWWEFLSWWGKVDSNHRSQ